MEKMKHDMNKVLIPLVLDTIEGMVDINDITCYEFEIGFNVGKKFKVKGVVKVEIDGIEEVE